MQLLGIREQKSTAATSAILESCPEIHFSEWISEMSSKSASMSLFHHNSSELDRTLQAKKRIFVFPILWLGSGQLCLHSHNIVEREGPMPLGREGGSLKYDHLVLDRLRRAKASVAVELSVSH